ncbi:hypothetical protein FRB99_003733 [Tulasnella sp. 403]|nr:hypothetical protein FRB99_003733 [Tulasnella sp. 403]
MAKGRTAAKRRESNQLRKQIEELEAQNARLTREIATKTTKETQARDAAVPPKKANSSLNRTAGQAQPKSKSVPDNTESGQDDGDQGSKPGSAVTDPNESESEDPLPKPKKPKKSNKLYNEDGLKHGQIRSQKGIIYNLKTGKIARPKGEPGRSSKPGSKHTGFALRESMGIPSALKKGEEYTSNRDAALASLYLAQRRFIKNGAAALLDTSAPLSQQSAASVGVLEARFFQKYPRFQEFYEKGWPFRAILQTVLTNLMKSSNDSDDEEQEEVDPREPEYRCSNTPKGNTTTTKRKQRVDQEDESEVEEDPTPKKKVKQVQKTAPTVPKSPIQAKQRLISVKATSQTKNEGCLCKATIKITK